MNKVLSRSSDVDTEKCVKNVGGNRFDLVLIAAARSREISRRHRLSESPVHVNAPITALLEVQEGEIGREYLKKV
jgi:DNA-directed RNA polymerase subunit K/omega